MGPGAAVDLGRSPAGESSLGKSPTSVYMRETASERTREFSDATSWDAARSDRNA